MKNSELQNIFLEELQKQLGDWKFVKNERHFKKADGQMIWIFHISCINHTNDFDSIGDVAVEYKKGKERLCIIGAELGNIEGVGQKRFPVGDARQASSSAIALYNYFQLIGLPFLQRFSNPNEVVSTLKKGGKEAILISPLLNQHQEQINALSQHYGISI
ncbi:MAG: hypothetical protein V1699_05700 [Candidatus Omnitrophota bacterium]